LYQFRHFDGIAVSACFLTWKLYNEGSERGRRESDVIQDISSYEDCREFISGFQGDPLFF